MNGPKEINLTITIPDRAAIEAIVEKSAVDDANLVIEYGHATMDYPTMRAVQSQSDLIRKTVIPIGLGILDCLKALVSIQAETQRTIRMAFQPAPPPIDFTKLRGH